MGFDPEGTKSGEELKGVERMQTLQEILDKKRIFIVVLVMIFGFSIEYFIEYFCIHVHMRNYTESVHNKMNIL